ncbi:MAG: glycosyl hydrolase 108 family protein [Pseudomonadota bacterium]
MKLIDDLIDREGGFVDNPADRGGATCWGITEAVARKSGYDGNMRHLPRVFAEAIYTQQYVNAPGFNKVLDVSFAIGEEMIDTGVNMGVSLPGPWLQRILNALNQESKLFPDLVVDGQLGPATISALKSVLAKRGKDGETVIMRALDCLQGARYLEITEKREKNEAFFFGWMLNRVGMP